MAVPFEGSKPLGRVGQGLLLMLEENKYYHIYNRGNNSQPIFFEEENYSHFSKLLHKYISPVADIFCYCLLPNHYHILIRIKTNSEIKLEDLSYSTVQYKSQGLSMQPINFRIFLMLIPKPLINALKEQAVFSSPNSTEMRLTLKNILLQPLFTSTTTL